MENITITTHSLTHSLMVVFKYVVEFGHISHLLALDAKFDGSLCGSLVQCGIIALALQCKYTPALSGTLAQLENLDSSVSQEEKKDIFSP